MSLTADVVNDTTSTACFCGVGCAERHDSQPGPSGNNDRQHVTRARCGARRRRPRRRRGKDLGGLPVVEDDSIPQGHVRVVLAGDYTGPGSGLEGSSPTAATVDQAAGQAGDVDPPPPSPVITAGSGRPKCVN